MTELILVIVIIVLLGSSLWEKRENKKERERFTNAIIAKTPDQFRDLELTSKVTPITPPVNQPLDFIPESEMGDEEFRQFVDREIQ